MELVISSWSSFFSTLSWYSFFLCLQKIIFYYSLYKYAFFTPTFSLFINFSCSIRDNFILLQAIVAALVLYMFPTFETLPLWNKNGITAALVLHIAISEPLFYSIHKCFHGDYLFTHYHSLHHSSPVPQPYTGKRGFITIWILYTKDLIFCQSCYCVVIPSTNCMYVHFLFFCSWSWYIFGTSFVDCCDWSTDNGFIHDWPWIDKFDLWLRFGIWFTEMLRPFQCGNHSPSYIWCHPFSQICTLHSNVSGFLQTYHKFLHGDTWTWIIIYAN